MEGTKDGHWGEEKECLEFVEGVEVYRFSFFFKQQVEYER